MFYGLHVLTSPSERVTKKRIAVGSIVSSMKCALPSAKTAIAPPECHEKISSLGPQLLVDHGQSLGPGGVLLLLMTPFRLPAVEFGGPETPLPVSGSAH